MTFFFYKTINYRLSVFGDRLSFRHKVSYLSAGTVMRI